MTTTVEQTAIITFIQDAVKEGRHEIVLVPAVAGAGKTYLLQQIVKNVPHKSGIYLSYNKSIAVEAATKFPASIKCLTANALAYRSIVKALGLRVGNFGYREIKERIPYENKLEIVSVIKEYCLSGYLDFKEFSEEKELTPNVIAICEKYLEKMYSGDIECTHDFYMKIFHIYLAEKQISFEEEDFLLIDESGDLNEVTLQIFKLFPAKIKIAVGDASQNIYGFNHTVNAFNLLKDEGTTFKLTKSFRVSDKIAKRIAGFCQKYLDPEMVFEGTTVDETDIVSRAILSRTNTGLLSTMISLVSENIPFKLIRSPKEIFKLPLMICFMKYEGSIEDPMYRHIQDDFDAWHEDEYLKKEFKSPLAYLMHCHEYDSQLVNAIRLVMSRGKNTIIGTYERTIELNKQKSNLTLATAHSVKGLEFDEVAILDDLNSYVLNALDSRSSSGVFSEEAIQELNLYYVACSRAKKSLLNATML